MSGQTTTTDTDVPPIGSARKAWQDYATQLARIEARRNRHEYQPVTDLTHGDHGLEGYTTNGIGYQAYYPDPNTAAKKLKKKIVDKVGADLDKLEEFKEFWEKTLAGNPLDTWVLITPSVPDKKLLAEVNKLARALAAKRLSFISPSLKVLLHTPKDYEEAAAQLGTMQPNELPLPAVILDPNDLKRFRTERQSILNDIHTKLTKIPQLSQQARERLVQPLCESLLKYEGHLQSLRTLAPAVAETLLSYRSSKADSLRVESELTTGDQRVRLDHLMKEVASDIASRCPKIPASKRDEIARGLIADWTSECPLDFPTEGT